MITKQEYEKTLSEAIVINEKLSKAFDELANWHLEMCEDRFAEDCESCAIIEDIKGTDFIKSF